MGERRRVPRGLRVRVGVRPVRTSGEVTGGVHDRGGAAALQSRQAPLGLPRSAMLDSRRAAAPPEPAGRMGTARRGLCPALYNVEGQEVVVIVIVGRKVGNTLVVAGEVFHAHQDHPPQPPGSGPAEPAL